MFGVKIFGCMDDLLRTKSVTGWKWTESVMSSLQQCKTQLPFCRHDRDECCSYIHWLRSIYCWMSSHASSRVLSNSSFGEPGKFIIRSCQEIVLLILICDMCTIGLLRKTAGVTLNDEAFLEQLRWCHWAGLGNSSLSALSQQEFYSGWSKSPPYHVFGITMDAEPSVRRLV